MVIEEIKCENMEICFELIMNSQEAMETREIKIMKIMIHKLGEGIKKHHVSGI